MVAFQPYRNKKILQTPWIMHKSILYAAQKHLMSNELIFPFRSVLKMVEEHQYCEWKMWWEIRIRQNRNSNLPLKCERDPFPEPSGLYDGVHHVIPAECFLDIEKKVYNEVMRGAIPKRYPAWPKIFVHNVCVLYFPLFLEVIAATLSSLIWLYIIFRLDS